MSDGANMWSVLGFIITILTCLLILLGFSTSYWVEPNDGKIESARFERIGLWEMCFRGYSDHRDSFGRVYNGCWWIFARQYDRIRQYLLPSWFVATQALMTINVVVVLLCVLLGLLLLLRCFPAKAQKLVAAIVCLSNYAVGLLGAIASAYFGTNAGSDRTWLNFPHLRHLSWSFYVSVFGTISAVVAGMCYTVYYIKIRKGMHQSTAYRAHELRYYNHEPSGNRSRYGGSSVSNGRYYK